MKIELKAVQLTSNSRRRRHYNLILSQDELARLFDLNEGSPVSSPYAKDGARFHLYQHPVHSSSEFRIMPDGGDYFAYLGDINAKNPKDLGVEMERLGLIPICITSCRRPIGTVQLFIEN